MNYNKESVLLQIKEVQDNINRLRTLVECDLVEPDPNVCSYCCMKAAIQLQNISYELNPMNVQSMEVLNKPLIDDNNKI